MAGNDDGLEVGEDVFLCQLAQDLVGEIERRQLFIIGGRAAGAPTVSGATPAHLVGRKLVAATSGALMFLQFDVKPARQVVERTYSTEQVLDAGLLPGGLRSAPGAPPSEQPYFTPGFPLALPLEHGVRIK